MVNEINVEAVTENLDKVTDFVNGLLEEAGCPMKAQNQIDVCIDELFSNIANYAYNPDVGPATIRAEVKTDPMQVILTFLDHGVPYDPTQHEDPDVQQSAEERTVGGLGIFMVKKMMDEVSYEFKDGQNILTIRKNF